MDDYINSLIENVRSSYSIYRRAMKDYLDYSGINENGEFVYSVSLATNAHDAREAFEEAYKNLQIAKRINDYEPD